MEWFFLSWPMLLLFGLGLRMALRLTYGARGPEPDDPLYAFLNISSWVFIGLGVVPAIVGGPASLVGLIVVLIALATLFDAVLQRRAAQRRSMCTQLALLLERGAKLEASVPIAGNVARGIVARAARRLFAALEQGTPLTAAVARHPAALPREAAAYLAAGQTTPAQLAALKELRRSESTQIATLWRAYVDRVIYLVAVLLVMSAVLTFMMIKIVPEFEQIFSEFEVELPATTQLTIAISNLFMQYLAMPFAVVALLLGVGTLVLSLCYLCDVRALDEFSDRLFRGARVADVLRILAIATEQRQPLPEVLERVGRTYPSKCVRRSVVAAADMIAAGSDWRAALQRARLVTAAERTLLQTAEQVGNVPWALRAIAGRRDRHAVYRLAGALQILYPAAILLLGAVVGVFVVGLFMPIVVITRGLS